MIFNQQRSNRRTTFGSNTPEPPKFAAHVESRLEQYYEREQLPNDAQKEFVASNLGIDAGHVEVSLPDTRARLPKLIADLGLVPLSART